MPKDIKLYVELVPKSCHYSNARSMVTPKQWNKIRFISYDVANNKCQICGQIGTNQGYKHNLECHEIWSYNDKTKLQKLEGLISLCPICHLTKHIGRASAMGYQALCFNQLELVNKWNHKQVVEHVADAYELYKRRSKYQWKLDISILNEEPFSLELDLTKKRQFTKSKWIKKPKKKKTKPKRPKKY